ncbi:uncharacterized protein LOC129786888 [Lutzomyia longipalpis]|uniref:uncharacterized protein LOC129786888 n=1 Tax=Lutzomyia longipalpis TaxID=7200 RepID=UPI002483C92C|nr:uncharacterized protein LOC129786888 [Lutzomyia longipalpis]
MPTNVTDIVPGPLNRLDLVTPIDRALGRKNDDDDMYSATEPYNKTLLRLSEVEGSTVKNELTSTTEATTRTTGYPRGTTKSPHRRTANDAFLTRKKVYKILENKFQSHGHPGKPCLLRAICEEAHEPINAHNGVLGDVIHIVLTPSSSEREDLQEEYYRAEELGHSGNCSKYSKYCSKSIIDYISKIIES